MHSTEILTSTPKELPAVTRRKLGEFFSKAEIAELTTRSDWRGGWAIFFNWAVVAGAFALMALWPNPLSFLLGLIVLASRQLAFAILQHEGAHGTLFKTRWFNEVFTDWTCARPIWQNLPKYRAHHLVHHTKTGTELDPDLSLHAGFPTTRRSLARKFLRDVTGITGLKLLYGQWLMDAGIIKWTVANDIQHLPQEGRSRLDVWRTALGNMTPMLVTNGLLFGVLAASGHPWLYGMWVLAYLTPLPLFVRIRSIAEHGCMEHSPDMFKNTRTTRAGWLARMTVAPARVNYHMEHHLMASVPFYRLPRMHALLRAKQAVPLAPGYAEVLRIASTRQPV